MSAKTFLEIAKWDDSQCREYLEQMRWPDGPRCPKCGSLDHWTINRKSVTKNHVSKLYRCKACRKQYTVTVGTIFEDSKIPLYKWLMAIHLMCSSKKGISALQLARELGYEKTYRTAWFMAHRIREAMKDKAFPQLTGTVEADETYVGPRKRRGHTLWHERERDEMEMGLRPKVKQDWRRGKATVFGMVERGGNVRTIVVSGATAKELKPLLAGYIDAERTTLMTNGNPAYRLIRNVMPHHIVNHDVTYVDGDTHTQNIEGYWSILKRGLYGVFHHVDQQYLPQYLSEFEFRFNRRKVSDAERFASLVKQTRGRVQWYCRTPQKENPHA